MAKRQPKKKASKSPDDLTKIEGIGPKIAQLFAAEGIDSFAKLARASVPRLRKILAEAGPRYRLHDPNTWKNQAALAKDGKWKELRTLQDKLDGGRRPKRDSKPRQTIDKPVPTESRTATVVFQGADGAAYEPGKPFVIERLLTSQEAEQEYWARKEELDAQFDRAKSVIKSLLVPRSSASKKVKAKASQPARHICRLIEQGNVTAISARYRTKFGQPVSPLEVVIGINVKRKLPVDRLEIADVLPSTHEGLRIKVVEGTFHLLSGLNGILLRGASHPANPQPFDRELLGGIPIAPESDPSDYGTLGVISKSGTQTIGLSCQHVVKGSTGSDVLQLGPNKSMRDIFSVIKTILPADRNIDVGGIVESVDCASVEVKGDSAVMLPPDGVWTREISTPSASRVPLVFGNRDLIPEDRELPLWKFGNGSGEKMEGRISILRHDLVIINSLGYENNFSITREDSGRTFATPGDSGSILALEATAEMEGIETDCFVIAGILFAALEDSSVGLGCTMVRVLKALNLGAEVPTVSDWFPRNSL